MILSDVCKIYDGTHQTPKYVDEGVPFYSVEHISKNDFSSTKFITEDIFQKECKRVSIEQGDVLMTRIGSVGVPKFVDWNVRASFYVSLALFKSKTEDIHMGWLSYYIQSPNIQRDIWRLTIHVAFPKKINLGDIGKIRMKLPSKSVQTSNYIILRSVDQKINLLTKKKEALETYKKGLMQKIFSQELRFKREDGTDYPEWKEAILLNICRKNSSGLSKGDLTTHGSSEVYGAAGKLEGYTDIETPRTSYVSIVKDGAGAGRVSLHLKNTSIIGTSDMIMPNEELVTPYFLYSTMSNIRWFKFIVGSTIPHIYFRDWKKETVLLPCLEEQKKIDSTLHRLGDKISTISNKIEAVQLLKKGLLQQMFV